MTNLFIRKLELRASLSEADRHALEQATAKVMQVEANRDLIAQGDAPEHAFVILEGFACRYKLLPDGGRSIVAYLIPGDGCDLHASILPRMVHSIGTLTPCLVARIPYQTIKELAAYHPNIYKALWWSVLVDEAILLEWLVGVGRRPADKQVAHFLCEMMVRLQAVGLVAENSYRLPITQSELADTAGLSHVHVNRVLQDLRKERLIEQKRRGLLILDIERLKTFAGFVADYLHLNTGGGHQGFYEPLTDVAKLQLKARQGEQDHTGSA
ncbi:Crp/Fnr family transcriptional regulator [Methylobacterium durans]|uniref:Crp/Fnr family transcriptional regulator n=1 Tax=Methylobacterium durans TaxID=2202825 RepID=UPI002B000698|nr:Crp/Fnr family transcriptional regulator [Methylobacterium durans]MEA1832664.1 Crp/Fnr family transcriptional regulator [Methylobacterium durans]